jgi:hypothetical protein
MKVKQVSFRANVMFGKYKSAHVEMMAELEEGDTVEAVMVRLKGMVAHELKLVQRGDAPVTVIQGQAPFGAMMEDNTVRVTKNASGRRLPGCLPECTAHWHFNGCRHAIRIELQNLGEFGEE